MAEKEPEKAHKKSEIKIGKINALKEAVKHSSDKVTLIHEQTLSAETRTMEQVIGAQQEERARLYNIIQTCEDEMRRKEAYARLSELDKHVKKQAESQREFLKRERKIADRIVLEGVLYLAQECGIRIKSKKNH